MAGARKLDVDEQQYPNLFGPDFQVDFRQHPGLGVVGAYSQYGGLSDKPGLLPLDLVARREQFASSVVKYGLGFLDEFRSDRKTTPQELMGVWISYNLRLLSPLSTPSFEYFSLKMNSVSEDHLPLLVGLLAGTPRYVPMVFPKSTLRTACHDYLATFALNSWYFAHAPFHTSWLPTTDVFRWFESFDVPNWEGFNWGYKLEMPIGGQDQLDKTRDDWILQYLSKTTDPLGLLPQNAPHSQPDSLCQTSDRSHRGYRVILNMCLK